MDWLKIGKGVQQGYILSPCLFNFYTEYRETLGWKKHKLESRLLGKNINNLRYAEDTTRIAKNEEELKSLLMNVKEESQKVG